MGIRNTYSRAELYLAKRCACSTLRRQINKQLPDCEKASPSLKVFDVRPFSNSILNLNQHSWSSTRLKPRPQEFVVFITLAPRGHIQPESLMSKSLATRVNVVIGAVIVVVDTIGPHDCAVLRCGDQGPSVW
eukprot:253155-Pyramimonas_sp.AAC.2